ncbi:hypothetical protein AC579_1919 [Pseudocercospora musae]|uniref:Uncharacterized protein n=1 Tax=Pseudocercospora musae TaxID=113226 RepID=A0A139HFF0_9PEZI|nr:hypothetical protein AC579_1919 [Pseudocercospora musae]
MSAGGGGRMTAPNVSAFLTYSTECFDEAPIVNASEDSDFAIVDDAGDVETTNNIERSHINIGSSHNIGSSFPKVDEVGISLRSHIQNV